MLELRPISLSIVRCLARADELDRLAAPAGALACRVARDELLLVGPLGLSGELLEACAGLTSALALDDTDAFAGWTLLGLEAEEALARLSSIEAPGSRAAFLQGAVAGVPAKVLVEQGRIDVLVSSALGHHVEERVLAACADLLSSADADDRAGEP